MVDTNPVKKKKKKKPQKGALIKGLTGKLPVEILDHPVFTKDIRDVMRGYSGIYLLYNKKTLYYVGLASSLLHRLKSHRKDTHAEKWDAFVIYRIKQAKFLKDLETLLIGVLNPPGNTVAGRVPRDADINKILAKVVKNQETSMAKIRKALNMKKKYL